MIPGNIHSPSNPDPAAAAEFRKAFEEAVIEARGKIGAEERKLIATAAEWFDRYCRLSRRLAAVGSQRQRRFPDPEVIEGRLQEAAEKLRECAAAIAEGTAGIDAQRST